MYIVDLADQTFRNLASPDDITIPSIAAFYRFGVNLGKLNDLLGKQYYVAMPTLEIKDENGDDMDSDAAAIYELIYTINYNDRKTRQFLGAGSVDVMILESASSDGGNLKFINRNEIAKSYIQMRRDAQEQLNKLVNYYKFGKSRAAQTVGDDENVQVTSNRVGANLIVSADGETHNNTIP